MTQEEKITQIGGKLYYSIFLSGANKILENQKLLNDINVFPVADADTGTNLASTIRSIIDHARPDESFKVTSRAIAVAALNGARGNSGVIFAQFLYGMSIEVEENDHLTIESFARALKSSVRYIYEAVAEPVEGTMLTVIKEWAEFIYASWETFEDFVKLFSNSYQIAAQALMNTTSKLKNLKLANVVDAGAKGFVLFLEGLIEGLLKKSAHEELQIPRHLIEAAPFKNIPHENFNFRYCTEALIKSEYIDKKELREEIRSLGDSIVVAGSESIVRLHIHTNEPQLLFQKLRRFGVLSYQKADNMEKQNEIISARKWNIAVVTDSTSDLPADLIDHYQIQMVPLNLHFGESIYLDKLTISADQFYDLLDESQELPSTSQPNEASFLNMYSHLASHYDSVIAVHLSDKFSGTYQNSLKAAQRIAEESGKKITVLDSKNVSGSLGLLTLRIAREIEAGKSHEEIIKEFPEWRENCKILVSVKNLDNFIRGGRVSRMKGTLANMLNLKPIIGVLPDGTTTLFDKAFSQKANMKKVIRHVKKMVHDKQVWNYIILHAGAEDKAEWFREEMFEITGKEPLSVINISPVIGVNSGRGAAAVSFITEP